MGVHVERFTKICEKYIYRITFNLAVSQSSLAVSRFFKHDKLIPTLNYMFRGLQDPFQSISVAMGTRTCVHFSFVPYFPVVNVELAFASLPHTNRYKTFSCSEMAMSRSHN